jgi:hypothetical protein
MANAVRHCIARCLRGRILLSERHEPRESEKFGPEGALADSGGAPRDSRNLRNIARGLDLRSSLADPPGSPSRAVEARQSQTVSATKVSAG